MAMNDADSDATVRYCPCCGQTVIISGIAVSCGKCDLVLGATKAKKLWPEEPGEWMQYD
jgi:hypothetical protein